MKFHHRGYVSGDPRILPRVESIHTGNALPDRLDVLVVGAGPAGMLAAAQLSMFPDLSCTLVERREGRLPVGQADGIQRRAVEMFEAFGFADEIMAEAFRIDELAYWRPDPDDPSRIVRTARTPDDPVGLSEYPHIICNQARVLDYFAQFMANSPTRREPVWGVEFVDLTVGEGEYPVEVRLRRVATGKELIVHAKYVLGGDGARSRVRRAIGAQHAGTVGNHAWGVLDVLGNTDFPDIRTKSIITSQAGSMIIIPREGGYMWRNYVDLGAVPEDDDRRIRDTPLEAVIDRANAILRPYSIDVKEIAWWSVYEVGHRITARFDDVPLGERDGDRTPRVFIAGDACHTHTAKAGQGMNVSMQDGFNIAWKLAHVLRGQAPATILRTYDEERKKIAEDLIAFDRDWSSRLIGESDEDGQSIEEYFMKTAEFPAGFMTQYLPGMLTGGATHQSSAAGYPIGKRFWSHPVVRRCDAVTVEIGHLHIADGRWRVYVFADGAPAGDASSKLARWAEWFGGPDGPVTRYTRAGEDVDALFDVKVVYQQPYEELEYTDAPQLFRPIGGPLGLEYRGQVFTAKQGQDIFDARGVSREGAVVLVRPDQYVAHVLPLDAKAELDEFLARVLLPQH